MKNGFFAALFVAFIVTVSSASAFATTTSSCIYASSHSNGTTTFPGTYVGTVGTGAGNICQIGNLSLYNGGTGGAYVNNVSNPSIYEFYWTGGTIDITEQIGNNGIGDAVDVNLFSLASSTATAPGALEGSTTIPFSSGPSAAYTVYGPESLGAGYYAIETELAVGSETDPNYQINFSTAATPEPSSLCLLGSGALALAVELRRRVAARPR